MPLTAAALKTEITTDPRGYGYAPFIASGSDGAIAAMLSIIRDGTAGTVPTNPTAAGGVATGVITIKRPDISPIEVLTQIDIRDLLSAPPGVASIPLTQSWFESITQFARIRLTNDDGTKTLIRKNIDRITGDTQGSQTRLDAVAVRSGSRAEELFGTGATVSDTDVALALRPQN